MKHISLRYALLGLIAYPAVRSVTLFGSRARGSERSDSDYDLAVYAEGDYTLQWAEIEHVVKESAMLPMDVLDAARASGEVQLAIQASKDIVYLRAYWYAAWVRLAKAMASLGDIMGDEDDAKHKQRDSVIARFQYVFELFWKCFKALEEVEGFRENSPRAAIARAVQLGWVTSEPVWHDMLRDRNAIAHSYNEPLARQLYRNIQAYYPELQQVFHSMEPRIAALMEAANAQR